MQSDLLTQQQKRNPKKTVARKTKFVNTDSKNKTGKKESEQIDHLYLVSENQDREEGERLKRLIIELLNPEEQNQFQKQIDAEFVNILARGVQSYSLAVELAARNWVNRWDYNNFIDR
ncbi:MAG: hypothetical protein GF332_02325 [Candidatus Moranbacteria bacterium]|nr:hypothetical protein [Candidatus Moranbacteria bacterium]